MPTIHDSEWDDDEKLDQVVADWQAISANVRKSLADRIKVLATVSLSTVDEASDFIDILHGAMELDVKALSLARRIELESARTDLD